MQKPLLSYVYCVTEGKPSPSQMDASILAGWSPIRLLNYRELTAWVSSVPASDFGEHQLAQRMKDMKWLVSAAEKHERVLDALVEAAVDLIPMKLCTLFLNDRRVLQMLQQNYGHFRAVLQKIAGEIEVGVNGYLDTTPPKVSSSGKARKLKAKLDKASPGAAYFLKQELQALLHAEYQQRLDAASSSIFKQLRAFSKDAVTMPPVSTNASALQSLGRKKRKSTPSEKESGSMILNCAFLVKRTGLRAFLSKFRSLQDRASKSSGLILKLSGPWPPYNFAR